MYAKSPVFFQENPFSDQESKAKQEQQNKSKSGEKLKTIMNENNIRKAIVDMASQNVN
jgi:hypothetical protein